MKKKILSLVLVLTVVCSTLASLGITASAASITGAYQYTYYAGCDSSMGTLLVRDNCSVDGHSMINNTGYNWSCSPSTGLIFYAKANEGYEFKGFYVTENNGTTRFEEGETTYVEFGGILLDIPVHDKAYIFKFDSLSSLKVEAKFEKIVNEENSVAKIGDTYYKTLKEAIDAAGVGETVTLLADVSIDGAYAYAISITGSDNLTIDLGGHTVTYTGMYVALMNSGGTVTVQNGNIIVENSAMFATADASGAVTNLKNVNITYKGEGSSAGNKYIITCVGATTLDNCTVTTTVDGASAFVVQNGGVITVNGGEYDGELSVLDTDKNSQIIINSGTFTADPTAYVPEGTKIITTADGKYVVDPEEKDAEGDFKVTTDSGYYGEYGAPINGIIAFNASYTGYGNEDITAFGLWLYVADGKKISVEATTAEALKENAGKFFATVSEITPEQSKTPVFAIPYVVKGSVVNYGKAVSATVNTEKWLGEKE